MKKQKIFYTPIILVIVFVAVTVLTFVIPFAHTAVFWISYLFFVLAMVIQVLVWLRVGKTEMTLKSRVYGLPMAQVSGVYLVVQVLLNVVFMTMGEILPVWVVISLDTVAIAAALLGLSATDAVQQVRIEQDVKHPQQTEKVYELRRKAAVLAEIYPTNPSVKALAEELRYSDPVSSEETCESERRIEVKLSMLEEALVVGNETQGNQIGMELIQLVKERNRIAKEAKR